jgi:hypothetical protein
MLCGLVLRHAWCHVWYTLTNVTSVCSELQNVCNHGVQLQLQRKTSPNSNRGITTPASHAAYAAGRLTMTGSATAVAAAAAAEFASADT